MRWFMLELPVADLSRTLAWYRDTLGLGMDLERFDDGFALVKIGDGRFAFRQGASSQDDPSLVFEVNDLDVTIALLAERGVEPDGPIKVSREGYRRAVIRDPDGRRIVLFAWTQEPHPGREGGKP
jgi:catechol 2,3-dioxygenase-like lactoylglutathione lyase family enzyme